MEFDATELKKCFFEDANEHLEAMESAIARLSQDCDNQDALDELFRGAHSMKGDSGALGFDHIASLLHHFESQLELMRQGAHPVSGDSVDMMMEVVDVLEQLLGSAQRDEDISDEFYNQILEKFSATDLQPSENSSQDPGQQGCDDAVQGEDFGLFADSKEETQQLPFSDPDQEPSANPVEAHSCSVPIPRCIIRGLSGQ